MSIRFFFFENWAEHKILYYAEDLQVLHTNDVELYWHINNFRSLWSIYTKTVL